MRRGLRLILWPAGLALAVAAEWIGDPDLATLDAIAGGSLVGLGLASWSRRPQSHSGPIMAVTGCAWFLGSVWGAAVYLHRGSLAHLLLSYPRGTLQSGRDRTAVAAAYLYAAAYPIAGNAYVTVAFALALVTIAARRYAAAGGPERRGRLTALVAASAFGGVLVVGAVGRLTGIAGGRLLLGTYDLIVCFIAVGLFVDLLWGRWAQAAVTGLVVDLGEPAGTRTLRDRLSRALGDPTLVIAYWLPGRRRYVDEAGQLVELPDPGGRRTVTSIEDNGIPIAALVHDVAVLDDPGLVSAVAAAARLAVSNARLQAEVRARLAEVESSRRRIVEAADDQRRRLERQLRDGAEQRLGRVEDLLDGGGPPLAALHDLLQVARSELHELGRGIHPAALVERGLASALKELAARSPVPVELHVSGEQLPPALEAMAFFVCSEALANVAKYAGASRATVTVTAENGRLVVEIRDDGSGGAEPSAGSGLRGLADRAEAFGGQLQVHSPSGRGTRVVAEIPLS